MKQVYEQLNDHITKLQSGVWWGGGGIIIKIVLQWAEPLQYAIIPYRT